MTAPGTVDETAAPSGIAAAGPLPPVASMPADPAAAPAAPTASDQAYGHHRGFFGAIGHGLKRAGQEVEVGAAEAVGVMELAGLRYPVKAYEAQVDSGLYRGSRVDEAGMASLKQQGIVGIVNLCKENNEDAAPAEKLGLKSLHVPILDNSAPSIAQMQEFIAFAQANPPTYVHCEAGEGRTGTAVACYRIAVDGWTADQAIAEGKTRGLSLINQISFVRHFAAVTRGEPAPAPDSDEEAAPAAEAPATDTKAAHAQAPEPTAI
jgi:protein tyrosine phosphatase (PTP) superfamily phosphohydrolase (DUF442 family)